MNYLISLLLLLWVPSLFIILRNVFEDVLTWQLKEYRFDRMIGYLRYDNSTIFRGKIYNSVKFTLSILSLLFFFLHFSVLLIVPLIVFAIYINQSINILKNILDKSIKIPKISIRNILILAISLIIIVLPFLLSIYMVVVSAPKINFVSENPIELPLNTYQALEIKSISGIAIIPLATLILFFWASTSLLLEILSPLIVTLGVVVTSPLASMKRRRLISNAAKKVSTLKNLKVIGITGSYGKTSVKEFLYQILSKKYNVVKTPGNVNTTIGLAEVILKKLDDKTEYFIAEMGAYKKNEISKSTSLIPIDIAIVTNIGDSHLEIFKSIENIINTKFELIEGLKEEGIAILNADNEHTKAMGSRTVKTSDYFSLKELTNLSGIGVSSVLWKDNKVKLNLLYERKKFEIETEVIGEHHLQNLLPAILVSLKLGFSIEEIKDILAHEIFQSSHFKIFLGRNNTLVIDDGYNSNSAGFHAALEHLKKSNTKNKVIVTKGILEMGSSISSVYSNLSKDISNSANVVITTDKKLAFALQKIDTLKVELLKNNNEINTIIERYINEDSTILIEGKVHPSTMNLVQKDSKRKV